MRGPGPLRVLVVDDNADFAEAMSLRLELEGHTVATAWNGAHAISQASTFHPDVVLLDLSLPKLNGYDAAKRIREQMGAMPLLIAMSGWAREEAEERARNIGFDHYLTKPIEFADLSSLLSSRRQEAEGS